MPTITGTAQVGQTLTAVTTGIADANGLTSPTYTYGVDPGDTARSPTLRPRIQAPTPWTAADLGKTIKVKVSFADDDGNPRR